MTPEPGSPSVSVIIPCYNRAGDIAEVVHFAQNQTCPAAEIIVVDDASTDESAAVLESLPVKLIRHTHNQGPAAARNTGFQASQGDIVLFIDADAYADEKLIEVILSVYSTDQDHRIGGVGGQGMEAWETNLADRWRKRHAPQSFGNEYKENVPYLYGLCASYRRKAFSEAGGFDPYFRINAGEDFDIGLRVKSKGYRLVYTPNAVVHHQHRDTVDSLKRVQFNWAYWSYWARYRNHVSNLYAVAGLFRSFFSWLISDLVYPDPSGMIDLDWKIFKQKYAGIKKANRERTQSGSAPRISSRDV